MSDLVSSLKEGVGILKRKDDDTFDRLSNRYTVGELSPLSHLIVSHNALFWNFRDYF